MMIDFVLVLSMVMAWGLWVGALLKHRRFERGPRDETHPARQRTTRMSGWCADTRAVRMSVLLINRTRDLPLGSLLFILAGGAVMLVAAVGYLRPALEPITYPEVVRQIERRFGGRELVLFEAENLPICFYMGRTLPYYQTREQLACAMAKRPDLVVIWEQQKKSQSPPPGQEKLRIHMRKRDIVLFEQK